MRYGVFAALAVVPFWYPLAPGNRWVYEVESLEGDMAHPTVERWSLEEAVARVVGDAVILRTQERGGAVRESRMVIRENCLYAMEGSAADFCFPMTVRGSWGKLSTTSPAKE